MGANELICFDVLINVLRDYIVGRQSPFNTSIWSKQN